MCEDRTQPIDTIFVIDRSGSMEGDKLTNAQLAANRLIGYLNPQLDRAGLVTFATAATLDQQLGQDWGGMTTRINDIIAGGRTNIADSIRIATDELFSERRNPGAQPVIILLSDGISNREESMKAADAARERGVRVITIGLGADVDQDLMRDIATDPSDYYPVANAADLVYVYEEIGARLNCEYVQVS